MPRIWRDGVPYWEPPFTEHDRAEMEDYELCGIMPFAEIPEAADTTNLTPFPRGRASGSGG
jgi:hypothetical protein